MMPDQIDKQINPDIKRRSVILTDVYAFVFIDDLVMFTKERLFCQEGIFLSIIILILFNAEWDVLSSQHIYYLALIIQMANQSLGLSHEDRRLYISLKLYANDLI